VMDASLVAAAEVVEHYEIARYGTLIAWADSLAETTAPAFSSKR
jgi:ferritin-like metal-binding protein YciE